MSDDTKNYSQENDRFSPQQDNQELSPLQQSQQELQQRTNPTQGAYPVPSQDFTPEAGQSRAGEVQGSQAGMPPAGPVSGAQSERPQGSFPQSYKPAPYNGGQYGSYPNQQVPMSTRPQYAQQQVTFLQQETLGSWLVHLVLAMVTGGIWTFIIAFSDIGSEPKKQWARASLILAAIFLAIYLIMIIGMIAMVNSALNY